MKRFLFFLLPVLLLFVSAPVYAADDENNTVSVIEGANQVIFYGTIEFVTADATDNHTTQAIADDGMLDWENAVFRSYGDATANYDINVFFMGSSTLDLTYATSTYTQTAFDDIGSATPDVWWAFQDTLMSGAASGNNVTKFVDPSASERFKIIKFDGQTGNPNLQTQQWFMVVPKKPGAPKRNAYAIFNTT